MAINRRLEGTRRTRQTFCVGTGLPEFQQRERDLQPAHEVMRTSRSLPILPAVVPSKSPHRVAPRYGGDSRMRFHSPRQSPRGERVRLPVLTARPQIGPTDDDDRVDDVAEAAAGGPAAAVAMLTAWPAGRHVPTRERVWAEKLDLWNANPCAFPDPLNMHIVRKQRGAEAFTRPHKYAHEGRWPPADRGARVRSQPV